MELAWQRLEGRNGHGAAIGLLEQMLGAPLPQILRTERGKPYFEQGPHFSISHTKEHVFCVVSDRNVGVDAEEKSRRIDERLAQRYLSERERQRLAAAPNQWEALLRLWVLKESWAKLTGQGIGNYLKDTDFDPFDARIQEIDGCIVAVLEELTDAI